MVYIMLAALVNHFLMDVLVFFLMLLAWGLSLPSVSCVFCFDYFLGGVDLLSMSLLFAKTSRSKFRISFLVFSI